jgi:hypothetical protein
MNGIGGNRTAVPIATSSDGTNDAIVWVMDSGKLLGVDGETGAMIYNGGNCSGVRQWNAPIAAKGRIIASGDGHLCSWSPR